MTTTVQHYLDKGLRGLWYPVLASWEVQSAPVGITRLGEQIVVWRNKDGQVQALEDRCPHRGARLSMGWNLGDRIACWYHGVEVAGNGEVKDVPAVDKCPLVGQQCVRSYKVQGWQRDMWRFMYRNRLEKLHWEVLEQDRVVLESLAPNARDHEYLYQHDVGLSRLRRMMQKAAKEQLAMREAQQGAA